jgi:hypothetical protein
LITGTRTGTENETHKITGIETGTEIKTVE